MAFSRVNNDDVRLFQPCFHDLECLIGLQGMREDLGSSCNSNECKQDQPGEANWFCA